MASLAGRARRLDSMTGTLPEPPGAPQVRPPAGGNSPDPLKFASPSLGSDPLADESSGEGPDVAVWEGLGQT